MSILYTYFNTGEDGGVSCAALRWKAQTFKPTTTHEMYSIKLKLYRVGTPGTVTVSINTTSSGTPTTTVLTSGTLDGNTFTTSTAGEWYEFILTTGTTLTAETTYAIVVDARNGTLTTAEINIMVDTGAGYADGSVWQSNDNGATWPTNVTTQDAIFEEYGPDIVISSSESYTDGNGLKIYVSCNNYPNNWIQCWCKRWDEDKYNITIETFLTSSTRDFLFKNVTPGSIREQTTHLGWVINLDGTYYHSSNTLILEPQDGYGLSGIREKRTILVKNISDNFINPNYFNVKIEGKKKINWSDYL